MGKTITRKSTLRGLDVLQTIYGVIMGLGLKSVFDRTYAFFSENTRSFFDLRGMASDALWANIVTALILFINTLLLGIRFFWVPRNLRRLMASVYYETEDTQKPPNWAITISLVTIVAHAGLYYVLCSELGVFLTGIHAKGAYQFSAFRSCGWVHGALLSINGAWILWLNGERSDSHDGLIWARSNLTFSLIALPPLVVLSTRGLGEASITQVETNASAMFGLFPRAVDVLNAFPTAPRAILWLFDRMTSWASAPPELAATAWVAFAYLLNSGLDLLQTARNYIYLEEVEVSESKPLGSAAT